MKKALLLSIAMCWLAFQAAAQLKLSGKVVGTNGEPVPFAHLRLTLDGEKVLQSITNQSGEFYMGLPDGHQRAALHISHLAFRDTILQIGLGEKEVKLHLTLPEKLYRLEEVSVKPLSAEEAMATMRHNMLGLGFFEHARYNFKNLMILDEKPFWVSVYGVEKQIKEDALRYVKGEMIVNKTYDMQLANAFTGVGFYIYTEVNDLMKTLSWEEPVFTETNDWGEIGFQYDEEFSPSNGRLDKIGIFLDGEAIGYVIYDQPLMLPVEVYVDLISLLDFMKKSQKAMLKMIYKISTGYRLKSIHTLTHRQIYGIVDGQFLPLESRGNIGITVKKKKEEHEYLEHKMLQLTEYRKEDGTTGELLLSPFESHQLPKDMLN